MGELNMHRQLGLKPNFSEIGRRYGLDRHTVARYWNEGGDVDDGRCNRPSGFDAHPAWKRERSGVFLFRRRKGLEVSYSPSSGEKTGGSMPIIGPPTRVPASLRVGQVRDRPLVRPAVVGARGDRDRAALPDALG